jgi:hypothetical protein
MENLSKKEKLAQYKERTIIGGVYAIKNTANGKLLLLSSNDLQGVRNRFEFSLKTGSSINIKLQNDWAEFGKSAFRFEVLEELEKKEVQTSKEFSEDVKTLEELWREKLEASQLY